MTVIESPMICAPIRRPSLPQNILKKLNEKRLKWAEGSVVDNDSHLNIDILVGLDHFWQLVKPNVCQITESLSAQETKFGWILSGSWESIDGKGKGSGGYQLLCRTDFPEHFGKHFWDLDVIGVHECGTKIGEDQSRHDAEILDNFNSSVSFEHDRYVVHLPWKFEQKDKLVDNKTLALKRADNLKKRLSRDPQLESGYNAVLEDLVQRGIVHEVPNDEIVSENPVFYLPHRPIVREASTTTKIRPVFDASAKGFNGISLNDCIEAGPNLIPNIIDVLLRFRRWKYGLTADIEKAFLQIKVAKEDQDVHRFIWDVRGQRKIMRFDRVIFGNASSPFLLNATIKNHLHHFQNSRVVDELTQNLYVDDWLSGADKEEEIEPMVNLASDIMGKGGFPLSKWGSNSSYVPQKAIKEFDVGNGTDVIYSSLKILGMFWDTNDDAFYFQSDHVMLEGMQFTKRLVLSFIARIYDPMGFLNPFTILIKIMFQDLWRLGLGWDDPLPSELQNQMVNWVKGFKDICHLKIPRCLSIQSWVGSSNMQLISFSDASERAFGCCVYLRVYENGIQKVSLVASRVRVAPLKKVTLPRLELLGALLAARLLCFVRTALNLHLNVQYVCFTDSTIVLHWIRADPARWKQFVRNRVVEIQELTNPSNWKHVPGIYNPADLVTRGVCAPELVNSTGWLQGPDSLESLDSSLEQKPTEEDLFSERVLRYEPVLLNIQSSHPCIDFNRYSHFTKAVAVMGWVLRFVGNLRSSVANKELKKTPILGPEELQIARIWVFKIVQRENFKEEIDNLKRGVLVSKGSPIFKLSPFLDENDLLKVAGRLHMSENYSFNEKHPIVLPKCHFTMLLIRCQHHLLKHAGVSVLLTSLRNDYWILGSRVLSKKVCRECIVCQKQNVRACSQIMAPLPSDRISRAYPFSVVGIDHAGPLYCQDTNGKKHYIVLFTCGVVRAVHLELADSLSLSDFMLAFRKFSSRRGLPSVVYSDNAKTFGAASNLVKQFGPAAPMWKFSIPLAPWYGGWWERLVRSTKSALKKSLGRALVSRSELDTNLVEVEACLNSRPLTYVGEGTESLTPSHFLLGRNSPYNPAESGIIPQTNTELTFINQENQNALDSFWKIWSEDYVRNLPSLGNGKSKSDLRDGSIVLIREEHKPRMQWPMGKVTQVIHSKDGLVRAVNLKTERGDIVRPVQMLYKLEVSEAPEESEPEISVSPPQENYGIIPTRSGRIIKPRQILDL